MFYSINQENFLSIKKPLSAFFKRRGFHFIAILTGLKLSNKQEIIDNLLSVYNPLL